MKQGPFPEPRHKIIQLALRKSGNAAGGWVIVDMDGGEKQSYLEGAVSQQLKRTYPEHRAAFSRMMAFLQKSPQ